MSFVILNDTRKPAMACRGFERIFVSPSSSPAYPLGGQRPSLNLRTSVFLSTPIRHHHVSL